MISANATICVIIAAKDAAATIQRAIRSALREPQVAEVVVVDDGSTDGTAQKSREADDGSGRLKVHRLDRNRGPAFARNHAISNSAAPLIAILDADDFFLKGRFDGLLDGDRLGPRGRQYRLHRCPQRRIGGTDRAGLRRATALSRPANLRRGQYFPPRRVTRRDRLPQAGDAAGVPGGARARIQ